MGGIGTAISGGLASRRNKEAQEQAKKAARDLTRRMEFGKADIGAYRPEAAEARMRALRARLGILEPLSNLTGEITGRPQADLSGLGESPLAMQPLPSQASTTAPGSAEQMKAYGIDPKDPRAQQLLMQKLQGYGYNTGGGGK